LSTFDKPDSGDGMGWIVPKTGTGFTGFIQHTDALVITDGFNSDFGLFG
jgi:hypothetical protein